MNEVNRVVFNKKIVFFTVFVFVLNIMLFIQTEHAKYAEVSESFGASVERLFAECERALEQCNYVDSESAVKNITAIINSGYTVNPRFYALDYARSQLEYLNQYNDYIASIQEQAGTMSQVSIFNKVDSFSSSNLERTSKDFQGLENVVVTTGIDESVTSVFDFGMADYLMVILVIAVCMQLTQERRVGLWDIVHLARGGRVRLAVRRVMILFVYCIVITILFYVSMFAISVKRYGDIDLTRNIQSLEMYSTFNWRLNVGEYIFLYVMLKIIINLFIGLICYVISLISKSNITDIFSKVVIIIAEYACFALVPVQSKFNMLKYYNIFALIKTNELATNYLNVNFFSNAVNIKTLVIYTVPVYMVLLMLICIIINATRRPVTSKSIVAFIFDRINRRINVITGYIRIIVYEFYKILFVQKGIIVLIVLCIVQYSAIIPVIPVYYDSTTILFRKYCEQVSYKVDAQTTQFITMERDYLNQEIERCYKILDGGGEKQEIEYAGMELNNLTEKLKVLDIFESRVDEISWMNESRDLEADVISEINYDEILDEDSYDMHRLSALKAIMFLCIIISGIFAYEYESESDNLIRCTRYGRERLFKKKVITVYAVTFIVFILIHSVDVYNVNNIYGINNVTSMIQSLKAYESFPIPMSILGFLVMVYMLKLIGMLLVSSLIIYISTVCNNTKQTLAISIAVICAPAAFSYIGMSLFDYLSVIELVSAVKIMLVSPLHIVGLVLYIACIAAIAVSIYFARRKWINT